MRTWILTIATSMALASSQVSSVGAECVRKSRAVDLTHSALGVPHWRGTRVEGPDPAQASELLMPLVVIDVHEKVARNADYVLSSRDVANWEKRYGRIPAGAFVAMRTDWSKRWPDNEAVNNWDSTGVYHYPGWSSEVLVFLYEQRGISAFGHETTDTDPGLAITRADYSLNAYIRSCACYQIALLANLDQVPEAGGLVQLTLPRIERGAEFPARVIAIVPIAP